MTVCRKRELVDYHRRVHGSFDLISAQLRAMFLLSTDTKKIKFFQAYLRYIYLIQAAWSRFIFRTKIKQ